MRDEEAYREHSCLHSTMDSRRDLNGRGEVAINYVCAEGGENTRRNKIEHETWRWCDQSTTQRG